MNNPIDLENIRELTQQEMCGLISESDKVYLHETIQKDPQAKVVWEEMHAILQAKGVQEKFDRLEETMTIEDVFRRSAKRSKHQIYRRLSIAAGIAIVLSTSVFSYLNYPRSAIPIAQNKKTVLLKLASGQTLALSDSSGNSQFGSISLNSKNRTLNYTASGQKEQITLIVPTGLDYSVNLPDGSLIYLNAGTTLQFPSVFTEGSRDITVNGEAYLQIAQQPGRPFTVHLPTGTVQVLGTEFNINTYNVGHSLVSLVDGAVKIHAGNDSTILKPGLQASFSATSSSIAIETFDKENTLSWRKGLYTFNNAGLQEITEVVPRWYGVDVVVDPGAKTDIRFSGILDKHEPLDKFLNRLNLLTEMHSYVQDGILHLK